jgi:hypothetical protein
MAIRGLVGAVYEDEAAPVSENIALLFDWMLEAQHRKEFTYGPDLHAIPNNWYVKAEAYWAPETMTQGQYFIRLFIGKGDGMRCLAGQVELLALKKTENICKVKNQFEGIGQLIQEG